MKGIKERTQHDSHEKHTASLRGRPQSQSHKGAKHPNPKPCEKHEGACKTPIERVCCQNMKEWKMKWNASCQITRTPESITLNKGAYAKYSDWIENLQ